MLNVELEQFNGPLDLLLQLIEGQELDISKVSLAKVTDQYLTYLDTLKNISPSELADFLVVATKLLVIKSRLLLPKLDEEEEDNADQLEAQIKLYKDYLEASKLIEKMITDKKFCFTREKIASQLEPTFSPPESLQVDQLKKFFEEILQRIEYVMRLPEKIMEKVVSLRERVANIREVLRHCDKVNFKSILSSSQSRSDTVVCFMALLELIKSNEIVVNQDDVFGDIMVEKI
ncbi:MAG: ScpA family protein [bacterium]